MTHILPATLETTQWGWFDNSQPPVLRVNAGDTVVLETMMHSHNQVIPGVTIDAIKKLRTDHPGRGPYTVTGPIYIDGAEPGDVLTVRINKIVPRAHATNFNVPGMFGQFKEFQDGQVMTLLSRPDRKVAEFAPWQRDSAQPFPGTLGVARAEPDAAHGAPGPYAGNMDIRDFIAGTTLYVPVFVKGALLWTGDSHAAQGNGEINLTALETAYREMNITVNVIKDKGKEMAYPRIETPTHWITMGYDNDLNKAWADAKAETIKFIAERHNVNAEKAAELMPQISDCCVLKSSTSKRAHCLTPKDVKTTGIPERR
jgi:acetamidase/formamidase